MRPTEDTIDANDHLIAGLNQVAMQASMPALPVPEIAIVISLAV